MSSFTTEGVGMIWTIAKAYASKMATVFSGDGFKKPVKPKDTGLYTAFGTWFVLLIIGWFQNPLAQHTISELQNFFTGNVQQVGINNTTFLEMIPIILLVVVIELPLALASGLIAIRIVGKRTARHALADTFESLRGKSIFRKLFLVVFFEELIFRWFFLGVLTHIPGFSSGVGFYGILLVSNFLFAFMHLGNYTESRDRQIIRTMPQFIGGMMFSFVFIKYGLVASTLAHFTSNAIIFSLHKIQKTNGVDLALIFVHGILAWVSWHMMDQPITDAAIWFSGKETFVLEGWSLGDYVLLVLFISSCFNLGTDVLLYDKNLPAKEDDDVPAIQYLWVLPIGIAIYIAVLYGMYWLTGFVFDDVPFRILICGIIFTGMSKNYSLSSAQRSFWVAIPNTYMMICIIGALGFWGTVWHLIIMSIIGLPAMMLRTLDD